MTTPTEWNALTVTKMPDGTVKISVEDPWAGKTTEFETLPSAFELIEKLDREHSFTGTIPIIV